MVQKYLSAADLLELEERQLRMFLTEIREVGEEKSDLYPEPQAFNATFMANVVLLPYTIAKITERCGDAATYGARARRVLSPVTALQLSGWPFLVTWGREMLLLEAGVPGQRSGVAYDDGSMAFADHQAADCLRFAYDATCNYRQDGRPYPSDTQALGPDYRVLAAPDAERIASQARSVDEAFAREVLGLMAAVRSLSFLMEAETRDALMVHGPYLVNAEGHQLVIFECNDLRWPLIPNFPLSGGVRWRLPGTLFPTANLAIALLLRDVQVQADRFGTLYINPLGTSNILAASLLTRGTDPYLDEGLTTIPVAEARSLRKLCDEIQEFMFLQVAEWDFRQRMETAVFHEQIWLLRVLAAAGYARSELEREQQSLFTLAERVYGRHFESIMSRKTAELPFYRKLGEFVAGRRATMFTRFAHDAT